jgi:UDP-N-acetylmuramoyl-L-alanine---L-glutamate ligase
MRVCDLDGRRVGLWGAGREAAATFRALGAPASVVVATDAPVDDAGRSGFPGAAFVDGPEAWRALAAEADVVVRSPGISRYREDVVALAATDVVLTTATNLWFAEHGDECVIGVTGTKGKSTTASLIAALTTAAGARTELAGNIGRALLDVLTPEVKPDVWVVELSSYQLADLEHSPCVAVVINLFREHLDWHGSEERYVADKLNLLAHDPWTVVLNGRDPRLVDAAPEGAERVLFGVDGGFDVSSDGTLVVRDGAPIVDLRRTALLGAHNALNAAAALSAAEVAGWLPEDPQAALAGFAPLPHRLQTVAEEGGLRFVDDSISTTPESAVAALQALAGQPVALLVGGQDRGQDFTPLALAIADHGAVRLVIGLPDNGARALTAIAGAAPTQMAADLDTAVTAARAALDGAGVVLLSPAAPSYGRFRDFTVRGARFREAALASAATD